MKSRRRAFTLIELLVVVAIIGVVIALLLPAIQKIRETANRLTCANNLHQMAIAAHAYNDQQGGLPLNYAEDRSRTDGSHNLFYGPFVPLLPFLELDNSYKNFSFLYYDSPFPQGTPGVTWPQPAMSWKGHGWHKNPFNRPPLASIGLNISPPNPLTCPNPSGSTNVPGQTWGGQGNFKVFSCPSQPFDHFAYPNGSVIISFLQGIPALDMPKGNPFYSISSVSQCSDTNSLASGTGCTLEAITYVPGSYVVGRSDYVAVVGLFHDAARTNPSISSGDAVKYRSLFNYNVNASLGKVPDGTSNTLLFSEFCGEFVPNPDQAGLNGWVAAGWASNGCSVAFGTCPDSNNSTTLGGPCDYSRQASLLGSGFALGGWHNGMFQVAFADGSVRPLRLGLDRGVLNALAGYNDGDVIPEVP